MIPRADKQLGLFFHLAYVFFDNHTLSSQVDYGAHVQKVAGQDDDIEIPRNLFDPVKLRKGIVEIGRKKTSHWANILRGADQAA